jgi:surface carbohydrate biosynthesis protein
MSVINGDVAARRRSAGPMPGRDHFDRAFYLLVEDAGRELDSRILLALQLLRGGAEVWIGQQLWFARNFAALKPGVALFKGNNMPQVANMRAARLMGHRTSSIDEEVFGLLDASGKRIHDHRASRYCDLFLAQGDVQRTFLEQDQGIQAERIKVVGNPRVDLSSGPARAILDGVAQDIRDQMGLFVLINTNFGAVNPHDQDTYNYYQRCISIKAVDPADPKSVETFHQLCEFEITNLRTVAAFISEFRRLSPRTKIVIRPHPAEDPGSWNAAHSEDPNVVVIQDNRHLAWIHAAHTLVHTSCTTGFEGYLLGARVIGLVPGPDNPWSHRYLSNRVGEIHRDPTTAARSVVASLAGAESDPITPTTNIEEMLHIDPEEMASTKLVKALVDLAKSMPNDSDKPHDPIHFVRFAPNQRQRNQMSVTKNELRDRLDTLGKAIDVAVSVEIETINRDVFRLIPAGVGDAR